MSQDSDKLKTLVNFKNKLEKKIEELDAEMKDLAATLEVVNSVLLDKGFKRGNIKEVKESQNESKGSPIVQVKAKEKTPAKPRAVKPESVIQLKTMSDEPLAIIYVDKKALHVMPDESKKFSVSTPPFQAFLVERVLAKMQDKDNELMRMGQLTADKIFAYNIVTEGDFIREVILKNVDEDRLKELKSSIRWTLEKMYEKTGKN
jgi:predicted house-cleaning noncanonical NTP pyrophosphatase (MazG superfamily)